MVIFNFRVRIKGGRGDDANSNVMVVSVEDDEVQRGVFSELINGLKAFFRCNLNSSSAQAPIVLKAINIQVKQEFETEDVSLSGGNDVRMWLLLLVKFRGF